MGFRRPGLRAAGAAGRSVAGHWPAVGLLALVAAICLVACGGKEAGGVAEALNGAQEVVLPDGTKLRVEVKVRAEDMARGMMYRDPMGPGAGMLFVHTEPGKYGYWMHNVHVPLDIIWMDREKKIVEISAGTPPCMKEASECPSYGGHEEAMFILELDGGEAAKHGLKPGDRIRF